MTPIKIGYPGKLKELKRSFLGVTSVISLADSKYSVVNTDIQTRHDS